jgi:hypothetical protein
MDKLDIIGRIIRIEDPKVLKQIEDLLLSAEALSEEPSASQKEKTYRIKGEDGFVFELADNFASLKTFKNGKHLAAEDHSLRVITRGYLEMLITNAGRFVKRSEIEKHICVRSETESASRISGKTRIYDVFRYTTGQGKKKAYTTLPVYDLIETVDGWDPEYRISEDHIEIVTPKKASKHPSRQ